MTSGVCGCHGCGCAPPECAGRRQGPSLRYQRARESVQCRAKRCWSCRFAATRHFDRPAARLKGVRQQGLGGTPAPPFILPSCGWSAAVTPAHRHRCEFLRVRATDSEANHCGLRSDDLGANKLSTADLAVDGGALDARDDCMSCAVRPSLGPWFGSLAGWNGFDGNNGLDQPRSRSSEAERDPRRESFDDGETSDAMSSNSTLTSFGMSKLGASPFATDAITASANLTSGCSHEP